MVKYFKNNFSRYSKNRFISDSFWALTGNVIGRGLALLAGIIVARFLGKDIYGEYGIIKNTILSVSLFSTFGLGYTATKYVAEYKSTNSALITSILRYSENITLLISGFFTFLIFLFSNYIAVKYLKAPHLNIPLKLISVWILFNAMTTTQIGILAGLGEFKQLAKINAIIGIITFFLIFGTYLVLEFKWGAAGIIDCTSSKLVFESQIS